MLDMILSRFFGNYVAFEKRPGALEADSTHEGYVRVRESDFSFWELAMNWADVPYSLRRNNIYMYTYTIKCEFLVPIFYSEISYSLIFSPRTRSCSALGQSLHRLWVKELKSGTGPTTGIRPIGTDSFLYMVFENEKESFDLSIWLSYIYGNSQPDYDDRISIATQEMVTVMPPIGTDISALSAKRSVSCNTNIAIMVSITKTSYIHISCEQSVNDSATMISCCNVANT